MHPFSQGIETDRGILLQQAENFQVGGIQGNKFLLNGLVRENILTKTAYLANKAKQSPRCAGSIAACKSYLGSI